MRIAAWALTILSALTCAWFAAIATMLIVPANDDVFFQNGPHAAAARASLLVAGLALANGVGALLLQKRRRPGALWIVLFAGLLGLAVAIWHYAAFSAMFDAAATRRVPDYADTAFVVEQGRAWLRWLLAWAALGFNVTGWAAWLVNRRIEIGHGRD